ncbi:MAG: TonB-dependent receptor plug domain-containing protein [Treponema sp.]|nr:TonB-dependent receptor plug domain-containing protein [Treponema sp.]
MNISIKRFIFITALFLSSFSLFARDIIIIVHDSDLDLPLEGAVVRTRDGGEYICDHNGRALIIAAEGRQIVIQAQYPGYETGVMTIPLTGSTFTIRLRLLGHLQGKELVIEGSVPGTSESRTGRSIAVSSSDISQTGEMGIIEDVMSTIALLPGVSYTGLLDAEPSIRGGHPGDMSASLNGFYINNPFFWGSTFSIFDPRMVESAQLSHGVFSARFGHTISGLLEITTKSPSSSQTLFDIGVSTSAASFGLSFPLAGKGGLLFMGRITYYDPFLALASALSEYIPELQVVSYFGPVPYIRTMTAMGNYRFTENLELTATAFFGLDGVGVNFSNSSFVDNMLGSETSIEFLFVNYQTFFTSSLSWNPKKNMLLKFMAGVGFEEQINHGDMRFKIQGNFSDNFKTKYPDIYQIMQAIQPDSYAFNNSNEYDQTESNLNAQGRVDYDWEISEKFLFSAGAQFMYNHFKVTGISTGAYERPFSTITDPEEKQHVYDQIRNKFPSVPDIYINNFINNFMITLPVDFRSNSKNNLFSTSGYILAEYRLGKRFDAELGLRVDHFLLTGADDFRMDSIPVFNPRLNMQFNALNGEGFFRKIDLTLGTGLFSSVNSNVFFSNKDYAVDKIKPNRSVTSVLGIKFDFPASVSLNIEGYFKYVFDRMYILTEVDMVNMTSKDVPKFDGEGMVWGLDVMLQRMQSRFLDGWISYSYSWTKYRDPHGRTDGEGKSGGENGDDWYFPSFHRFHTLNLILNYKPIQTMNLYLRLGFSSGVPLKVRSNDGPISYPVYLFSDDIFIEKYYWDSFHDGKNRTTPSVKMDIKFSIFGGNKKGKSKYEIYVAVENVLGLLYSAQGNQSFNQYTGELEDGMFSASFDIPIPIPSFGFKYSY